MDTLELFLLFISIISFYTFYKLKNSLKTENQFMSKEAYRIIFEDAKANENYDSEGREYTSGLALIKNKENGKYDLIAQAKVCGTGLR